MDSRKEKIKTEPKSRIRPKTRTKPKTKSDKQKDELKNLKFPYTFFRPLFGTLSFILFLFCLHSLIYLTAILYNSPDCEECKKSQVVDKDCDNYCDIGYIDDFAFTDNSIKRNDILTYICFLLLIRCITFLMAFIGVFQFIVYCMTGYVVLHLGLIIAFVFTLIYFLIEGKSFFRYLFGTSTMSRIVLSMMYTLETIVFITGVLLWYKFFRIKLNCKQRHRKRTTSPKA